ncbi:hypothetical protein [Sulfurimonas sp. HSL3-7]|uniref:hypothetical protein n=1 Tax=Sulfonitrofixus jiaomeiensis TaxID=3131938 RepID=UPI0031F7E7E9
MMGKSILAVFVLLFSMTATADVNKGKRYYMKSFKQKFKMNGLAFTQLHTAEEWSVLFEEEGKGFISEFSRKYPEQKAFLEDPKLWKKLQHVRDFAIEYAKDSGNIPSCGEDEATETPIELEPQESSSEALF